MRSSAIDQLVSRATLTLGSSTGHCHCEESFRPRAGKTLNEVSRALQGSPHLTFHSGRINGQPFVLGEDALTTFSWMWGGVLVPSTRSARLTYASPMLTLGSPWSWSGKGGQWAVSVGLTIEAPSGAIEIYTSTEVCGPNCLFPAWFHSLSGPAFPANEMLAKGTQDCAHWYIFSQKLFVT